MTFLALLRATFTNHCSVFSYRDYSGDFMQLADVTKATKNNGKKNISNLLQHCHAPADKPDVTLLCRDSP